MQVALLDTRRACALVALAWRRPDVSDSALSKKLTFPKRETWPTSCRQNLWIPSTRLNPLYDLMWDPAHSVLKVHPTRRGRPVFCPTMPPATPLSHLPATFTPVTATRATVRGGARRDDVVRARCCGNATRQHLRDAAFRQWVHQTRPHCTQVDDGA